MAKIRRINLFDVINISKLISFICADENIHYKRLFFMSAPMTFLQSILPLFLRKLPETYVAQKDNILSGVITLKPQNINSTKWEIIRLFLNKNSNDIGKQLVDYVVSHFGAIGATTFYAAVNETETELLELFVKGSKFRMCSCSSLYKMSNINYFDINFKTLNFRTIKDSDSGNLAKFFNDNIFPTFKNSLQKDKTEFKDLSFKGLAPTNFRYLLESNNEICAYTEFSAYDETNYFIDIIVSQGYVDRYGEILSFTLSEILKRNKNVTIFIKNRKYLVSGFEIEKFFKENKFEFLENKIILVKDFYQRTKDPVQSPAIVFSSMKSNNAFMVGNKK